MVGLALFVIRIWIKIRMFVFFLSMFWPQIIIFVFSVGAPAILSELIPASIRPITSLSELRPTEKSLLTVIRTIAEPSALIPTSIQPTVRLSKLVPDKQLGWTTIPVQHFSCICKIGLIGGTEKHLLPFSTWTHTFCVLTGPPATYVDILELIGLTHGLSPAFSWESAEKIGSTQLTGLMEFRPKLDLLTGC